MRHFRDAHELPAMRGELDVIPLNTSGFFVERGPVLLSRAECALQVSRAINDASSERWVLMALILLMVLLNAFLLMRYRKMKRGGKR